MWDLSGRDAQPSIDMLICFLVFGTPVACISCAWCAIAQDGDGTPNQKPAKSGGPCYFLGMFCLLVGLASQDWTTVNWDDSAYADAMVRLSGMRHNEANLQNTNKGSTTYVGPYEIKCRATVPGVDAACHPNTPFGYTPPEPVPKFEAVPDMTWNITHEFCFDYGVRRFSFDWAKGGGRLPFWDRKTSDAQQRAFVAMCGGVWSSARAFSVIAFLVGAGLMLVIIPMTADGKGEPGIFSCAGCAALFPSCMALIALACWAFVNSLLVDAYPGRKVGYGAGFTFWCVGTSLLLLATTLFFVSGCVCNRGEETESAPGFSARSSSLFFTDSPYRKSAKAREVELAPTPAQRAAAAGLDAVMGQPVVVRSPPVRGMSGIDIHHYDD